MLGIRTPPKNNTDMDPQDSPKNDDYGKQTQETSVRLSIGKWETGKVDSLPKSPLSPTQAGPQKLKTKPTTLLDKTKRRPSVEATEKTTVKSTRDRIAEARACLQKAKINLGEARNLKTDIKVEVTRALDRLYVLVKEAEAERKEGRGKEAGKETENPEPLREKKNKDEEKILYQIERNRKLLVENQKKIEDLNRTMAKTEDIKKIMEEQKEILSKATYASVVTARAATVTGKERTSLHSVIISSKNDQDTGEEVLERVRRAIDAKEGWIQVEKVRKAKDRKIVVGCATEEERRKVKERLEKTTQNLVVEEVKNRDPLLVIKDVLSKHTDEEILKALRNQNREIFHDLDNESSRMVIKYRKKARNPHTNHIVLMASPTIWRRAVDAGKLRVDLQRVSVEDQSPLVQCSRCLGYGHGRRFCRETEDLCSHCGGPHLNIECPERIVGETPECINCRRAKMETCSHNAFSKECPVRKKWDTIARATVSYC